MYHEQRELNIELKPQLQNAHVLIKGDKAGATLIFHTLSDPNGLLYITNMT